MTLGKQLNPNMLWSSPPNFKWVPKAVLALDCFEGWGWGGVGVGNKGFNKDKKKKEEGGSGIEEWNGLRLS